MVNTRSLPCSFIFLHLSFIILHSSFCITPIISAAEVVRLPAVAPLETGSPGRLVSHPDSSTEILQATAASGVAAAAEDEPQLPPGARNGVFQKILFDATWLAHGGWDGFGMTDLQLKSVFALPCPTIDSPLLITPGFAVHYLDGPNRADLPPRLHEGYVQFRWLTQATPTLGIDLAVTPGVYSDFLQEDPESFRITGHAATAWTWTERAKIVLGAAYLDRPDAVSIPIGGLIWTPNDGVKRDLVFPHPKVSRRIRWERNCPQCTEDWIYLAGEFAGDAWAIRRADGDNDQVVLSDYRVILGVERKSLGGLSSRVEVGYVFSRRIRYTSGTPEYWPTDTVMVRGGLSY
ncbi:MAG: hypothetical protein GX594_17765 [Pirellulaceae bacterium]|nr:hypothetical protein [Pirellulaceae bacterium]